MYAQFTCDPILFPSLSIACTTMSVSSLVLAAAGNCEEDADA